MDQICEFVKESEYISVEGDTVLEVYYEGQEPESFMKKGCLVDGLFYRVKYWDDIHKSPDNPNQKKTIALTVFPILTDSKGRSLFSHT